MQLIDELCASEKHLSSADLDHYRAVCREDALFIMPGLTATLAESIAGLEQSSPWDSFELADVQLRELGPDAAVIIYRFTGRRGEMTYSADMASTYERDAGRWQLVIHQQTPVMSMA